ncbi:MAG TPA: hypothetical protein VIF57_29990 [Polyangia bacterium]|jgi:hypothetical protein
MNDDEWNRWAATYAQEQRPMPPVLARARTDRGRAVLGATLVYGLAALLVLSDARHLLRSRSWPTVSSFAFTLVFAAVVIVGMHVAMWGTFGHGSGTPLDLLADLERRHAGRRRLLRFMPWLVGFAVLGTVASVAAEMIAAGRFDAGAAAGMLIVAGVAVGFVWLTMRRIGRLIDRELREAAEARRLLSESDD